MNRRATMLQESLFSIASSNGLPGMVGKGLFIFDEPSAGARKQSTRMSGVKVWIDSVHESARGSELYIRAQLADTIPYSTPSALVAEYGPEAPTRADAMGYVVFRWWRAALMEATVRLPTSVGKNTMIPLVIDMKGMGPSEVRYLRFRIERVRYASEK